MKIRNILLSVFLLFTFVSKAQYSESDIKYSLEKLKTLGSVLYIAAHPDDENTRLITYLTHERNLRVGYASLTRGDGGQNLIGSEQGTQLGLIRTQELLAARRIDGAEQFFTRAYDFGYSKNPEETFEKWNRDSLVKDLVLIIRKFKPDVIICRFPTTGEGGHGHHTASAMLTNDAFDLAADANYLSYVEPWKTTRLFWNTFNFGSRNTTAPDQIKIDVGTYNSLLGVSYGEISAESRSQHRSQGFGSAKSRGETLEYFKYIKGETAQNDILDGVNTTWERVKLTKINKEIDKIISTYNYKNSNKTLSEILALKNQIENDKKSITNKNYLQLINYKIEQLNHVAMQLSGLFVEATTSIQNYSDGDTLALKLVANFRLQNSFKGDIEIHISTTGNDKIITLKNIDYSINLDTLVKIYLPENIITTQPYWLENGVNNDFFTTAPENEIGLPENNSIINVKFILTQNKNNFEVNTPVKYKYIDPSKGEVYQPIAILPALSLQIENPILFFDKNGNNSSKVLVKSNKNNMDVILVLENISKEKYTISPEKIHFEKAGEEKEFLVSIKDFNEKENKNVHIKALAYGKFYDKKITKISYEHIPDQYVQETENIKLIYLENYTKLFKGKEIGYIVGAGDKIPEVLSQLGFNVKIISEEDLRNGDFKKLKTIITGIRAYNTNSYLQTYHSNLMEWIKDGGKLIVQYNTNSRVGPLENIIGPYPFTISRDRVTDENAVINITDTSSVLLKKPFKIETSDFDNWIQERGIYFVKERNENYKTLFSIADKNENPSDGSLIYTNYGKGTFIYTGLVFFRQLPVGNKGAIKLFCNLLWNE